MADKIVVLYSGGMDSTLLLHFAKQCKFEAEALLISYGQKHVRELETAQKICEGMQIPFHVMSIDLGNINSGLTGDLIGGMYEGVSEWHVPGRNTIFVGMALSLAETIGADKIWYGANMEDRINLFPDCFQEWVHQMSGAVQLGGSRSIELEAPLLGMRKSTIVALAARYGITEDVVHSGYHE